MSIIASNYVIFAEFILLIANHKVTEWAERGIANAIFLSIGLIHIVVPRIGFGLINVIPSIKIMILVFIIIIGWVMLSARVKKIPDPHASFRNSFAGLSHSSYK